MRQLPLEKTLELIEKLEPQIIGSSIYDKYKNEITTEKNSLLSNTRRYKYNYC